MIPPTQPYRRAPYLMVIFALVAIVAGTITLGAAAQGGGGGEQPDVRAAEPVDGRYAVTVDCSDDAGANETSCTFQAIASGDAKDVGHLDVPVSGVCAEVVGGVYEYVAPDPNTGVTGFKSRGSRGTLTLILTGAVRVDGTATYAIKAGDGVIQVTGPGLVCDSIAEPPRARTERAALRLVTFYCPTQGESRTEFSEHAAPDVDEGEENALTAVDLEEPEDGACSRAAAVGFAIATEAGEDIVRATTNGIGEAEVALSPATYTLREDVLGTSTEVTLTGEDSLTLAVVISEAVPLAAAPTTGAEVTMVPVAAGELEAGTLGGTQVPAEPPGLGAARGEVTERTGALVMLTRACHVATPIPGAAWDVEVACPLSPEPTTFRLTAAENSTPVPASIGTTVEGTLSFDRLPPGRYQLEALGWRWCHATSDSIGAEGQIVVTAEQRATIWVYRCREGA